MSEGSGIERRAHPRFELMAQIRVKWGSVDYVMELSNISLGGALLSMGSLQAPRWIQTGRVIEVSIVHPIDFDTLSLKGEIVRVQRDSGDTKLGVKFLEVADEERARIEALVRLAEQNAASVRPGPPPLPK